MVVIASGMHVGHWYSGSVDNKKVIVERRMARSITAVYTWLAQLKKGSDATA